MDNKNVIKNEPELLKKIKMECHKIFGKDDGKELLKDLKEYFIFMIPTSPPVDGSGREIPTGYGQYREGQNEMIRMLGRFGEEHKASMVEKSKQMNEG